jgi:O-methyltransferase
MNTPLSQTIPQGPFQTARYAIQKFGIDGTLARYLLLKKTRKEFIHHSSQYSTESRHQLLEQFDMIQQRIICAHSPGDYILIASMILETKIDGPIIECGAYKGGSSAKLSLIAKLTNRHLYVCDSFAGIPKTTKEDRILNNRFETGDYLGTVSEVKRAVEQYGSISNTTFVQGYFEKTLQHLKVKPAIVMMDVDLVSSACTCLRYLWPKTKKGGIWFTHEAELPTYIHGVFDKKMWHRKMKSCPPLVIGAINGATPSTPALAYFKKE